MTGYRFLSRHSVLTDMLFFRTEINEFLLQNKCMKYKLKWESCFKLNTSESYSVNKKLSKFSSVFRKDQSHIRWLILDKPKTNILVRNNKNKLCVITFTLWIRKAYSKIQGPECRSTIRQSNIYLIPFIHPINGKIFIETRHIFKNLIFPPLIKQCSIQISLLTKKLLIWKAGHLLQAMRFLLKQEQFQKKYSLI